MAVSLPESVDVATPGRRGPGRPRITSTCNCGQKKLDAYRRDWYAELRIAPNGGTYYRVRCGQCAVVWLTIAKYCTELMREATP